MVVFGGVFDPPHAAHVRLSAAARDATFGESGWLVFVPAARAPLKDEAPEAGEADRLAMLRLAIADLPRATIWTDELDRARAERRPGQLPPPSYTVDTLKRARRVLPPAIPMRLLIGSDQARAFHRWHRYREVIELAEPLVLLRDPDESVEGLIDALRATGAWEGSELARWAGWVLSEPRLDVSSTAVRAALARGDEDAARAALDGRVLGYIRGAGLYRAR